MTTRIPPVAAASPAVAPPDPVEAAPDPTEGIHPATGGSLANTPTRRELLLVHGGLLLVAIVWGGNFTAMKSLLGPLQPVDIMVTRSVGAALCYAAIVLAMGRFVRVPGRDARRMVLVGVLGVAVVSLVTALGLARIDAGLGALLVVSNPIFTAIVSRMLLGEPLTRRKVAGILIAFAGFLLLLQFGSGGGARLDSSEIVGALIVLCGPLAWAFYTVLSKPLLATYPAMTVASYTTMAGGAVFLPLLVADGAMRGRLIALDAGGWLTVGYVSLLAIVLGYLLWYWALRVLTASQTAVYTYLVPVFGVLASWLVLDVAPGVFALVGGAVIVAGVVLTNTGGRGKQTG